MRPGGGTAPGCARGSSGRTAGSWRTRRTSGCRSAHRDSGATARESAAAFLCRAVQVPPGRASGTPQAFLARLEGHRVGQSTEPGASTPPGGENLMSLTQGVRLPSCELWRCVLRAISTTMHATSVAGSSPDDDVPPICTRCHSAAWSSGAGCAALGRFPPVVADPFIPARDARRARISSCCISVVESPVEPVIPASDS